MAAARTYFTAIDSTGKYNLYQSDGTAAGTARITVPTAGASGLAAAHFAVLGTSVLFEAFDAAGSGLYALDATTNTATRLAVGNAAPNGLSPSGLTPYNGRVYFQGFDSQNRPQLFSSDGTAAGTAAIPLTADRIYINSLTVFGNKLVFAGERTTFDSGVYISDGTVAGTTRLTIPGASSILQAHSIASLGDRFVFEGTNSANKLGLFVSDGTTAGTAQLNVPGVNPSGGYIAFPSGLLSFGGKAAFTAQDAAGKVGVWITDGTAGGTLELPGVYGNAYGIPMTAFSGGQLAFIGLDSAGHGGVYITDGTVSGTRQLATPGVGPAAIMALGGRLLFDGTNAAGQRALYSSDGTAASTVAIQNGIRLVAGNIDVDTGTVADPISVAAGPAVTLQTASAAVVGQATPGVAGDTLRVSLLNDPAFAGGGSTVAIDGAGTVTYTAGLVTAARAGTETVTYRVTDVVTGQTTDATAAVTLRATGPALGFANATSGASGVLTMDPAGAGGPGYLANQYIYAGSDSIAFSTQAPNVFIHSGGGNDSIQVGSGQNVLDGGTGSNFLTGGTGTDTFFTDARSPAVVWNTIRNFHAGDAVTLWGFVPDVSSTRWEPTLAGAAGSEGATLRANIVGGAGRSGDGIDASITFTGLSLDQAKGLQFVTGTQPAGSYLYIYNPGV